MRKLTLCLIGLLAASTFGCISHDGQLAILLTSTPGATSVAARQVNVEIISVDLWDSTNRVWLTVAGGSQVHELIGLDGRAAPVAFVDAIEQGNYTQVRITFSKTNSSVVTDTGRRDALRIDPETVEVQAVVSVIEDASSNTLVEIDLGASLTLRGNGSWVLRPVMRQVLDTR